MGKLYFITGDIIKNAVGMDAIVNAQNKYMINGSGICGAIYRAAGRDLLKYCEDNYHENMEVGEVRVTPGFSLNMDIIHVYAPIRSEWDNPIEKLKESYINMLNEIKNKKYKKVIIPSLGTGAHGYSYLEVASIVVKKLYEFCVNNDTDIYFINRNSLATNAYFEELKNIYNLSEEKMINMIINEKECFEDFVDGKELDEMNLYEMLIYRKVTCKDIY